MDSYAVVQHGQDAHEHVLKQLFSSGPYPIFCGTDKMLRGAPRKGLLPVLRSSVIWNLRFNLLRVNQCRNLF